MSAATTNSSASPTEGPLAGLVVVDTSTTLPGAQTSQFLADCGADVVFVEPPGGSPLRQLPGWPGLLRGKRSVTLDLRDEGDLDSLRGLLVGADVLITTMRPSTAERIGFTPEVLAERFPRLVTAAITGWGSQGPWSHYKGYEALVMAKAGVMHAKRQLSLRPGPSYISTPYASFAASQAAIQGLLAALLERETSGRGQVVESDLVRAVGSMDPYNWFYELVLKRFPGAYSPMDSAYDEQGQPQAYLIYALLIASTKDGTWLQFAQTAPRLMQAWLAELDVAKDLADPKWAGFPMLPTVELRVEWWDKMLAKVAERSLEEWGATFVRNTDVSAEVFRSPEESFEHPQVVQEGRVATVQDPDLGPVRQPSTLVHSAGRPLTELRRAPRAGEHGDQLASLLAVAAERAAATPVPEGETPRGLPLEGITILELGTMFAGPYGATLLTDMGARVIKIESLEGDNIRQLVAFPEAGGAKVLQGKESFAVDLRNPEGLALVHELAAKVDVVLQCFRGGVAERTGVGEETLKALNPSLVYLSAPGYGVDGPYAGRPAYAPTIGAASGISVVDGGGAPAPADLDEKHLSAMRLHAAGASPSVQADGVGALGVGTALMLGIYARAKGVEIPQMVTTMLGTAHQALISHNVSYADRPALATPDEDFLGLGPLYRMYAASDGWVFLAAPASDEWDPLVTALAPYADLAGDDRFSTAKARAQHADALADVLAGVFVKKDRREWEDELSAQDVGCVEVAEETVEWVLQDDEFFEAGYSVEAVSPIFDEHRRLAPLQRFSRSATKADAGCTIGQHTAAVLAELGYDEAAVADLATRGVVGL
ncbi:CaiB/BaiF CoA transferase family protein [Nocardioides pacificus]